MVLRIFGAKTGNGSRRPDSPILPTKSLSPRRSAVGFPKRYARLCFLLLSSLAVFSFFYGFDRTEKVLGLYRYPPRYEQYHEREATLPQHNLDLPYPEGRDAKYFWAANHVWNSGWGNAMQELLLNAHLSYETKRAFVFDNFTWDRDGPEFSDYNGKLIPARIPMSAMISGPLIGGPFPPGDDAPRAVSKNFFNEVCPNPTVIDSGEVNEPLRYDNDIGAQYMMDRWIEKLNSIADPCVEIAQESYQLFEIWVFGSRRVLDIWPTLSKSPILTEFRWSPLIRSAFNTNIRLFQPSSWISTSWLSSIFGENTPVISEADQSDEPYPGLLVLHIRKGDFEHHCYHLANWSSDWNGFNAFPELPDKFSPPPGGGGGYSTPENRAIYLKHCFPSVQQIVEKVTEVQKVSHGLRNVYVMTNASPAWLEELKVALRKTYDWDQIASSRDLKLSWEQKYVAQTVDMMIGQRAQVFIGNGFSSLTSNVVMLRMARGVAPEANRFW